MSLPNAQQAVVDIAKLSEYCLSASHPRGRQKARVFESALGVTAGHAKELKAELEKAALEGDAIPGIKDRFGERYVIDFEWERGLRKRYFAVAGSFLGIPKSHVSLLVTFYERKTMTSNLTFFAPVALLRDLPEHGLARGQVGTVVEVYSPTDAEVEFVDSDGHTYGLLILPAEDLIQLHHQPQSLAA